MPDINIDYIELQQTCEALKDVHNSTNDRQLPAFIYFKQEDVQYCFDHGWYHYVELVTYLNFHLVNPDPEKTKVSKVVNGRARKDKEGFHYYYEHLSPAQETFFTSKLKLTWSQVQKIYMDHFEPEPNHLGVAISRSVKSLAEEYEVSQSTLSRYLNREYIRRHAVPGSYDK